MTAFCRLSGEFELSRPDIPIVLLYEDGSDSLLMNAVSRRPLVDYFPLVRPRFAPYVSASNGFT